MLSSNHMQLKNHGHHRARLIETDPGFGPWARQTSNKSSVSLRKSLCLVRHVLAMSVPHTDREFSGSLSLADYHRDSYTPDPVSHIRSMSCHRYISSSRERIGYKLLPPSQEHSSLVLCGLAHVVSEHHCIKRQHVIWQHIDATTHIL